MKIRFFYYLNSNKGNPSIVASIRFKGVRVQAATGYTIKHDLWNQDRNEVRTAYNKLPNRIFKDAMLYNNALRDFRSAVFDFISEHEQTATPDNIKAFINAYKAEKLGKGKSSYPHLLTYNWDLYIDENKRRFSDATQIKHKTVKNHIEGYQSKTKKELTINDISEDFVKKFIDYLFSKGLSSNTVHKCVGILKTALIWMHRKKIIADDSFRNAQLPSTREASVIALTEDELKAFEAKELSGNERLDKVRDLFLVQVYTGLRYSDLQNLKPENIDLKHGLIRMHQIKTTEELRIGIPKKLNELLMKYNCILPKITNQKYNAYLKELAEMLEINEPVQIVKWYGKRRVEDTTPKHKLISSHTARRTFITLTLKKGALPELVMKISGHRSRAAFQKYVKVSQNEAVNKVKNLWDD